MSLISENVNSIGGGKIVFESILVETQDKIYKEKTFAEIKAYCLNKKINLYEYVLENEDDNFFKFYA